MPIRDDDIEDIDSEIPTGTVVLPVPEEAPEPPTPEERLAGMLTDASDWENPGKVMLYRKLDEGNKLGFCKTYTVAEFESGGLDMVRRQWGPGIYQIRMYESKKLGTRALVQVEIMPLAPGVEEQQNAPKESELATMMRGMAEMQAKTLEALMQRPPPADPQKAMLDNMQLIGQLKNLFAPEVPATPNVPPKSAIEQMTETMTLLRMFKDEAKDIGAPETPPDALTSMLAPMAEIIKATIAAKQQQQPPEIDARQLQLPGVPLPPIVAPPSFAVSPQSTQQGAEMNQIPQAVIDAAQSAPIAPELSNAGKLAMFRSYIGAACSMAASGNVPPDYGADFLLTNLDDETLDAVEPMLHAPNWLDSLKAMAGDVLGAQVEAHKEWFAQVRDIAITWIDEPADEGDDDPGNVGIVGEQVPE